MPEPIIRHMMILVDDCVGQGMELAFPKMSTCTAVVIVSNNDLIGGHFTADPAPAGTAAAGHTNSKMTKMLNLLGGNPINQLLIVGFNNNHNPQNIKDGLGCGVGGANAGAIVEAYDIARKDVMELTLVFTFVAANVRPDVEFKRQSKVVTQMRNQVPADQLGFGRDGVVKITSTQHFLRRHFVQL